MLVPLFLSLIYTHPTSQVNKCKQNKKSGGIAPTHGCVKCCMKFLSYRFLGAQQWLGLENTQTIWPTHLAQVLEAVLERVPVTWGCYVEASGLGKGCGLAFYLQTQA